MSSRGGYQDNKTSSSRGRSGGPSKRRGSSTHEEIASERGGSRGRGRGEKQHYKRESMVAKPTVLIKGTPTILGAKQLQLSDAESQQQLQQQQTLMNNPQSPVILFSPNNTSATFSSGNLFKNVPPPITRILHSQQMDSDSLITPATKSPILLNKSPIPSSGQQLLQKPILPANKCTKFMNENFEILMEQVTKILSSSTAGEHMSNDYTVIGLLGEQGVGKSTIGNEIARRRGVNNNVFPIQDVDNFVELRHETNGMDIYIIPEERLIVIDSQPLFSSSMLIQLIQRGGDHYSNINTIIQSKLSPDVMSFENHVDLLSVQIGLFLFSICHIVLIVMDDDIGNGNGSDADGMVTLHADVKMLRFVQTMRMLQKGVPNSLSGAEEGGEYVPDVVFIYNRVRANIIENEFCVRQIGKFLDAYMTNTNIRKNGAIHPTMGCARSETSNHVNFFLVPDRSDSHLYATLIRTLRNGILHLPRTCFAKTITERDWLQSSARIWELIRKSPFISEYNRSYQKLALCKT